MDAKHPSEKSRHARNWLLFGAILLGLFLCVYFSVVDRRIEFWLKARSGQPIVQAIEQYHTQTGDYPARLAALAPKYLPTVPDMADRTHGKFSGWEYWTTTNGVMVSYTLIQYMGRGTVEYELPNWIGEWGDGYKIVLIRNK
jgi:hypothetical protein